MNKKFWSLTKQNTDYFCKLIIYENNWGCSSSGEGKYQISIDFINMFCCQKNLFSTGCIYLCLYEYLFDHHRRLRDSWWSPCLTSWWRSSVPARLAQSGTSCGDSKSLSRENSVPCSPGWNRWGIQWWITHVTNPCEFKHEIFFHFIKKTKIGRIK